MTNRLMRRLFLAGAVAALVAPTLSAQLVMIPMEGVPDSARPHLLKVREHLAAAEEAAGDQFSVFQRMLCLDASAGNDYLTQFVGRQFMTGPDQDMEPIRAFDNLYYVGLRQNGSWAVVTSGGIILLDTLNVGETESRLIPNIRKAGLDPADIKIVVVGHAHGDHMGGARYLQEKYGAKVYMSKEDWDFAEKNNRGRNQVARRDGVIADKQKITLGDTTLTAYFTPGHTPGAMSVVVPVRDGNTVHYAAWWGGPQWGLRNTEMSFREQMDTSMTYFREMTTRDKADVFLETHPFMSGLIVRMAMVKNRKPATPHPMVVGTDGLQRYLTVWQECGRAAQERYRVQELLYGPDRQKWPPKVSVPPHVIR